MKFFKYIVIILVLGLGTTLSLPALADTTYTFSYWSPYSPYPSWYVPLRYGYYPSSFYSFNYFYPRYTYTRPEYPQPRLYNQSLNPTLEALGEQRKQLWLQEKFASNQGVALRPIIKQEKQAQENPSIPKPLVAPDIETSKPQEK
ncbi:MAG TPA: hypothetical protein DEP85_02010 [Holosporales bacterium]|nr:MAG: hypothetical protein A3C45_00435 [Deltaproteobacteria bacterium RIFCSPHIGHO2_02_FULL_40_28]OGQ20806.1 MAG: hypothetical protein A3E27_03100 [Deltaproteobacteria bacterium RIFCSPHIGHO2_12_FULL_40_32]OGQ39207.1 MAG: hypothetical protein A3I69_04460 [Deltaproteobacteria bacterium RIFCSPLOWO2_02_FULL_40_36]OGQ54487.1 MAG: hypothetical protein A3G32_07735 [Deltaproteobacteria bacterium RIFCSPLOWO2_12_FULL_40_28]HCC24273.1 hypothetical protein [Holosporales bacterium]